MKGSRGEWIVLVVLLAVLVAVSVLVGGRDTGDDQEVRPNPSTYNAKGSGSLGLYFWLKELGVQVSRWERPLRDFPDEATLLLVLGPRSPLEEHELNALDQWVRDGGVLVLADHTVGGPVPGIWAGAPALRFGLQPTLGGRPTSLRPAFPSRYSDGVEIIRPEVPVRFQRGAPEGWAPLFADTSGDVVAVKRLGQGTVIAITDPGIFSNARLEVAGHARLALNIIQAHGEEGLVLVDEFHHGYGQQDAFFRYLRGTTVPWMLGQAALAFLVFLVARGTRFGAPVPPGETARASTLEHVAALGDLYRRAGARRLATEALAGSLRRNLADALGVRTGEDLARLSARAARRLGVRVEQVKACLVPGPRVAASDEALLQFAQAVHRLERRLRRRGGSGRATEGRG